MRIAFVLGNVTLLAVGFFQIPPVAPRFVRNAFDGGDFGESFAAAPCRVCPSLSYCPAKLIFLKTSLDISANFPGSFATWISWERPWILVQLPHGICICWSLGNRLFLALRAPGICDPATWKLGNFLVSLPQTRANFPPSNCATFWGCVSFGRLWSIVDFLKNFPVCWRYFHLVSALVSDLRNRLSLLLRVPGICNPATWKSVLNFLDFGDRKYTRNFFLRLKIAQLLRLH